MTNSNLRGATIDRDLLDPERSLALFYVPAEKRAALAALWQLDAHLGTVLAAGAQLILTQMKLAWWREALVALDSGPAPAEPTLQLAEQYLLPHGLSGTALSEMTVGWEHLLVDDLTSDDLDAYCRRRGGLLFRYSAQLLAGRSSAEIESAGSAWALTSRSRMRSRAS